MTRKLAVAGTLVLALAGCAATAAAAAPARTVPPARHCLTVDVSGGRWDEPVTFCGQGLPSGTWQCPAKAPLLPGARLAGCYRQR